MAATVDEGLLGLTADSETVELLDAVETALRMKGDTGLAEGLLKLQQDTGTYLMGYDDKAQTPPGPGTAALAAIYEPITPARFNAVLRNARDALPESELKNKFGALADRLTVGEAAPAPGKPIVPAPR